MVGNRGKYNRRAAYPNFNNHYKRRHKTKYAWCSTHHHYGHHHYVDSRVHISSHIYLGVTWPWRVRYHRHWAPRYRYRQVVYVDAGWGGRRRSAQVDVRTTYKQRIRHANDRYAEVDIEIESVEIYQGNRYLGYVDRIPSKLRKMRATVYADGRVEFDRNIFLVGDRYSGFEMISTRHYDDYLLNAYNRGHKLRVGRVDLYRGRVKSIRRSRLFDPYDYNGFVPISLLPDDDRLWDYGNDAIYSGYYDDDYDDYYYDDDRYDELSYRTERGVDVSLKKETYLERLD